MKEYILDCAMMTDKAAAHEYLAKVLEFPEYYGKNLDALYDCLSEMAPCKVTMLNPAALNALGEYGSTMRSVFLDVSMNSDGFELVLSSGSADSADN